MVETGAVRRTTSSSFERRVMWTCVDSASAPEEWETRATFKAMENATSSDLDARFGRLVIGGKGQGCDVMVYEAETGKRLYKAKPPPPNWLGYRAPPWVSATCFASTSECVRFFVGTGEHRFRHYDTREAKRAVLDLDVGKTVITSVASSLMAQRRTSPTRAERLKLSIFARENREESSGETLEVFARFPCTRTRAHVACAGLDQYVRVYDAKTPNASRARRRQTTPHLHRFRRAHARI